MATRTSKERYKSWYDNKGAERNARRRAAYAKDTDAQEVNRDRAKKWREDRAAGVAVQREVFRVINGRRTRVFSIGQIADRTGYASSTLRLLIVEGVLPATSIPGVHRFYTAGEVSKIESILRKRRA